MKTIKSLECIKVMRKCCHLISGYTCKGEYIPFYCMIKKKRIMYPGGSRKCKNWENPRITKGILGEIDMRKGKI